MKIEEIKKHPPILTSSFERVDGSDRYGFHFVKAFGTLFKVFQGTQAVTKFCKSLNPDYDGNEDLAITTTHEGKDGYVFHNWEALIVYIGLADFQLSPVLMCEELFEKMESYYLQKELDLVDVFVAYAKKKPELLQRLKKKVAVLNCIQELITKHSNSQTPHEKFTFDKTSFDDVPDESERRYIAAIEKLGNEPAKKLCKNGDV